MRSAMLGAYSPILRASSAFDVRPLRESKFTICLSILFMQTIIIDYLIFFMIRLINL